MTNEEKVLAIVDAAPTWLREYAGVHGFYCVHGGHGLERPASVPAANRALLSLCRQGVLEELGRKPLRCRRVPAG